jgi:hypothetical protein
VSKPPDQYIQIDITNQKLAFFQQGDLQKEYRISTSKYGIGNQVNSYKTPLGKHMVINKIGKGVPLGGIFSKGKFTGETCYDSPTSNKDLITSRILILEGLEPGINSNSRQRNIWVHGTQQEELIGSPASHGCIRLKNADMIELFDRVDVGTILEIVESKNLH